MPEQRRDGPIRGAGTAGAATPSPGPRPRGPFGPYGAPDDRLDQRTLYVDPRRRGDHTTVHGAVEAVDGRAGWTLVLAAAVYRETVLVPTAAAGLTLLAASGDARDTVIVHNRAAGTPKPDGSGDYGTSGSATVTARADGFTARDITFANDWLRADHPGVSGTQAVALKVEGDRSAFYRCRFLGHQDTLYADSRSVRLPARQFFRDCYVEGDVDFVFGRATAVFESCEFHTLDRDTAPAPLGYVFAPSTARDNPRGFLVHRCRVTSAAPNRAYKLARPWVPTSAPDAWPMLTLRDTWLGPGIDAAVPYRNMRDRFPWQDQRFTEYATFGPGAEGDDPAQRPRLDAVQAAGHTVAAYLGDWTPQHAPRPVAPRRPDPPFRLFVAGDSTAAVYEAAEAPRAGWGQALPAFTGPGVEVVGRALPGASSRSYADAGLLDAVLRDIEPGDWLLVSFGHNDQKLSDPARGTEPYGGFQAYLRAHLDGARQRGAHPVLVTPVERRRFRADGTAYSSLGDYPAAMAALARQEGVPLVDLNAASLALWQQLGPAGSKDYFLWLEPGEYPGHPAGREDDTHFRARGAIEVARLVAADLSRQRLLPRGSVTAVRRPVADHALRWPTESPELT